LIRALGATGFALALTACGGGSGTTVPTPTVANVTGSFVFEVTGTDPNDGDYGVVGSFVADGKGNITSGVADYNLGSGIDSVVPLKGTYTVSTGGAVAVSLTDGGSVKDTFTATIPTGSANGLITAFDGTGTGLLYPQTTTGFTPVGSYTFTVTGEGNYTVTGSGSFVVGPADTFTGGTLSYQDGNTLSSYTSPAGFLFTPNTLGRGQGALNGNNLSYYVIGPKQIEMINLDARALLLLPAQKQ